MDKIASIHQKILDFLLSWKEKYAEHEKPLHFTMRRINNANRLGKGYWFYGTKNYIAVSFWTGMNWKNKTPNIIFVHWVGEGGPTSFLEVINYDSQEKIEFLHKVMLPSKLGLKPYSRNDHRVNKRYRKNYNSGDPIKDLEEFLSTDKLIIDRLVAENQDFFSDTHPNHRIDFISKTEFSKRLSKVRRFQKLNELKTLNQKIPDSIRSFEISSFGSIIKSQVTDIPLGTQWIFVTGENGAGKTSLLRALAVGLSYNRNEKGESIYQNNSDFKIALEVTADSRPLKVIVDSESHTRDELKLVPQAFSSYGPVRLFTEKHLEFFNENRLQELTETTHGLFHQACLLRDLRVYREDNDSDRFYSLEETLIEIIPNIGGIRTNPNPQGEEILYYQYSQAGILNKEGVTLENLPSGTRNLVALIQDILVRFHEQRPQVEDPSEYEGIVLIDEIDIHLHPKLQKEIVQTLSTTFPKLQFIVTTHSPIPLLGAPKNSVFLKVSQDNEKGMQIEKLDIDISNLLPNTLLSSPIFGFHELLPVTHDKEDRIRTEDNYQKVLKNDEKRAFLKNVADQMKNR